MRLNGLATGIGKLGITVAALVLVVLIVRYAIEYTPRPPIQVVKDVVDLLVISVCHLLSPWCLSTRSSAVQCCVVILSASFAIHNTSLTTGHAGTEEKRTLSYSFRNFFGSNPVALFLWLLEKCRRPLASPDVDTPLLCVRGPPCVPIFVRAQITIIVVAVPEGLPLAVTLT